MTAQRVFDALTAGYGTPPAPVIAKVATADLARQIATFSLDEASGGTRHTDDLLLAIREVADKERSAGEGGSDRTVRELRERLVAACRGIPRGAAAAQHAREQGGRPGLRNASPRAAGPRQWSVGSGGVAFDPMDDDE